MDPQFSSTLATFRLQGSDSNSVWIGTHFASEIRQHPRYPKNGLQCYNALTKKTRQMQPFSKSIRTTWCLWFNQTGETVLTGCLVKLNSSISSEVAEFTSFRPISWSRLQNYTKLLNPTSTPILLLVLKCTCKQNIFFRRCHPSLWGHDRLNASWTWNTTLNTWWYMRAWEEPKSLHWRYDSNMQGLRGCHCLMLVLLIRNHIQCWCFSLLTKENSCVEVYAVCGTTQLSQICSFTCHVAWHHGIIETKKIPGEIDIESAEQDLTDWCKNDEWLCMVVYKVSNLFRSSQGRISSTRWLVWIEITAYPADWSKSQQPVQGSLRGWGIPKRPPKP